jgi:hypothetical protein
LDTTRVSYLQGGGCSGKDTGTEEVKLDWMNPSVALARTEFKEEGQTTF